MMTDTNATIDSALRDVAIDWHLRTPTMGEDDWQRFVAWLETPAHAQAYDAVVLQDAALADARPAFADPLAVAVAVAPQPRRRWPWAVGGTAVAAALVAVVVPTLMPAADTGYVVSTRAGERRTIELADATRIDLNGATTLRLDRADPRVATLERGEATFRVRHDVANPFTLMSGAREIRDLGTVFNVVRAGARFEVSVAEGSVMVDPRTSATTLAPGDAFVLREDTDDARVTHVAPGGVGGWRDDRLAFAGTPLSSVAAALERRYAVRIRLDGDLSDRPFTGMVALSGAAERDVPHIAALIGATWRRDGQRWILAPEAAR